MSKIKVMNERLANMIAAGEVVDRPASIIKELVENAIDAKASEITIEVLNFGMKMIKVTDNGVGMDSVDAKNAFLRHATSKVYDEFGLSNIHTLGFRGEALAAISSVSKVILKTRTEDSEGIYVKYEGGHFIDSGVTPLNKGTVVEVYDLFFNTPARFKYIKSETTERLAIIDIFDRLALSYPNIRFKLYLDEKLVKETFATTMNDLLVSIYGKNIIDDLTFFEEKFQKITIKGYLITPSITRTHKRDISIFINGRYIKNYGLVASVIDGYKSYLMTQRYPVALIYLEIDPSLVDVNVHPQKHEVKLMNDSLLRYQIEHYINQSLKRQKHEIPSYVEKIISEPKVQTAEVYERQSLDLYVEEKIELNIPNNTYISKEVEYKEILDNKIPAFDYIGVFSGTYLLFQNNDGLFMVDQHAAQERIRYEYYIERFKNPVFSSRTLLISMPVNININDFLIIEKNMGIFESYGFKFSNNQLIEIPNFIKDSEVDVALESMIQMIKEDKKIDLSVLRDQLAKDISCKSSIKANKPLNMLEINRLIQDLRNTVNPYHCPHGRPTIIKITHQDVEKMFKRIVT